AVLMLERAAIPPNLHLRTPNPHIPWSALPVRVASQLLEAWPQGAARMAGVSSFGFSGANAHAVIEGAAPVEAMPAEEASLFVLSARTPAAVKALAAAHVRHLDAHPAIGIAATAQATRRRRAHLEHRVALVCASRAELRAALEDVAAGRTAIAR